MKVECFTLEDRALRERYDGLFEACPDAFVQQSTAWAEVIAPIASDRPYFLLAHADGQDVAGMPLYLFRHPLGNALSSVPQAGPLGGVFVAPSVAPSQHEAIYEALLRRAEALALEHECLSLSIITNPFQPDHERYARLLSPTYTLENFTQWIPMRNVVDEERRFVLPDLLRRSNLSRNVKKALDAGFTVKDCDTDEELAAFHAVHARRHAELGVDAFPLSLFQRLRDVLVPAGKARLLLVKKGDAIASGCIYLVHRHVLDVLRITVSSEFLAESPNFLNTRESLLWAHDRGVRIYNWQSSPSRDSGVYRYKAQWGARELPYYFVTKLYCEASRIRSIGLDVLKRDYALHFVVPYSAFEEGFDQRFFRKA